MNSSRANAHGVPVVSISMMLDPRGVAVAQTDRRGFPRYTVVWRDGDIVRRAATTGNMTGLSGSIKAGDTVNIIRNGHGSIIHIEKAG